jgi:hypothetical protein
MAQGQVQAASLPTGMSLGPFAQSYGAGLLAPWTSTTGMQLSSLYPAGMNQTGKASGYYNPSTWGAPGYQAPPGGDQSAAQWNQQLQGMVPQSQSAAQMTQAALAADAKLPEYMRVTHANNLLAPGAMEQFNMAWQEQYAKPSEAQLSTDLYQQGRQNSTFGGAQMGSLQGVNTFNKMKAGGEMYQQAFNNFLNLRSNFFGNEGQMAQNANNANIQRGLGVANQAMNAYQAGSQAQNNFNQNAYGQMLQAQNQRENMQFNQMQSINQNRQNDQNWNQSIAGRGRGGVGTTYGGGGSFF